jgi:cell division protein FtsL
MSKRKRRTTENYVVGNTAIAYDYAYELPEEHQEEAVVNNRIKNSINPMYTVMLISVIILMLLTCVVILKAQFQVAVTAEQVMELKNELTSIRRENAHLESRINEELDLLDIKRIAMEEYGMVYPTDGDVIYVEMEATSYTVQHGRIERPVAEKTSLGNVLAFITRGW